MDIRISLFKNILNNYSEKYRSILIKRIKTLDFKRFQDKTYRQIIFIIRKHFIGMSPVVSKKNIKLMSDSICKLFKIDKK